MAWSGGNFTRANPTWVSDAAAGIGIEAARHDTQDNDFTTGINECLNKTGQNGMTGTLSMGSNKISNLAAGTARNDAAQVGQVQDGATIWCGTSGGTISAYTLTPTPAISAYAAGQVFRFIAHTTSNGSITLQVSGLASPVTCLLKGSKQVFGPVGIQLITGLTYEALYDGTNFLISDLLELANFTNDAGGARVKLFKSRGTTAGTNVIVQNGDALGQIDFYGASGSEYTRGAFINATVTGSPGATNDMPTSLTFATAPEGPASVTERMRITNTGRVGIGVTPTSFVHIQNNESATINSLNVTSNVAGDLSTAAAIFIKKDNNLTTSQVFAQFLMNGAGAGSGQINANGALQAAFGSYSDERLKENIENLPSQLANIFALRPVEFDYKDGAGHQIGFIAQEVQQIYPDLIGTGADGFFTLSGLGKNEARMIKAFQEFAQLTETKIAALEARIAALEA